MDWDEIDKRAVDTSRVLAADAVEKAGSGHPGTAMSLAPVAYLLYQRVLRHDPSDALWPGRDRFILSPGHSALTQYVQLYLGGFGLELDDLRELRTWGSRTPGHPEYGHTRGVEMTTGPLGQGLASAVGFAYASRYERGLFDPDTRTGESPFDHFIFVLASDGDLQEGVTSEASSLAGHQRLGNLVVIYDSNSISIEDDTGIAFTEDVADRYTAYGWHVQTIDWGKSGAYVEDVNELNSAIEQARSETSRPSLIILRTIIGWPSPGKQNSSAAHGNPLGADELRATKRQVGFDPEQHFAISKEVLAHTRQLLVRGAAAKAEWQVKFDSWAAARPERKELWDRLNARELPKDIADALPSFPAGRQLSTRAASGAVINALAPGLPELWGGSADLAESNLTTIKSAKSFVPSDRSTATWSGDQFGKVLHFGIREHAMAAILNGIVLHGPTRAFGGTFLVFSDYMRPALRLAALMGIPAVFVWTHDSLALGGDGPTHQPVEHLATLRAIPNFAVVRPADANETAAAWLEILRRHAGPTGLVLSRQDIPVLARGNGEAHEDSYASADYVAKGAYVLAEAANGLPDVILIATGSEVQLALVARTILKAQGMHARVVSVPCLEWFLEQDDAYRDSVLPPDISARVSVEAGIALSWRGIVGDKGRSVSVEQFGASADQETLFQEFGITTEAVVRAAQDSINSSK